MNGQKPAIASDGIIYYMNGQSIEALAFRVVRRLLYFSTARISPPRQWLV